MQRPLYSLECSNLARLSLIQCDNRPDQRALVFPTQWRNGQVTARRTITFGELKELILRLSTGFLEDGIRPGQRVVLLAPVGMELYVSVLALAYLGAVVVFIDPQMGGRKLLRCIARAKASAIVSVNKLLKYRFVVPSLWGKKRYSVDSSGLGCTSLATRFIEPDPSNVGHEYDPGDDSFITFTSGTTGQPKGARRTLRVFRAIHEALRLVFPDVEGDVDMTSFPIGPLYDIERGITSALPPCDMSRSGDADGQTVVREMQKQGVTRIAGAPAFLSRIVDYLERSDQKAEFIRMLIVGGAPVSVSLAKRILSAFPNAKSTVLYGSTEVDPIATVSMEEIAATPGRGHLVGHSHEFAEVELITPREGPLDGSRGVEDLRAKEGEPGEVLVAGPHVISHYFENPRADALFKLRTTDKKVWHRTGDVARMDSEGRLWILGRIADAFEHNGARHYPLPLEEELSKTPGVRRVAIVTHETSGRATVIVQPAGDADRRTLREDLGLRLDELGLTPIEVGFVEDFPVDARHNSRPDRAALERSTIRLAE